MQYLLVQYKDIFLAVGTFNIFLIGKKSTAFYTNTRPSKNASAYKQVQSAASVGFSIGCVMCIS